MNPELTHVGSLLDYVIVGALVVVCCVLIVALWYAVRVLKALADTVRVAAAAIQKSNQELANRVAGVEALIQEDIALTLRSVKDAERRPHSGDDGEGVSREFEAQMRTTGRALQLNWASDQGWDGRHGSYSVGDDLVYVQHLGGDRWRAFVAAPDNDVDALVSILGLGRRWLGAGGAKILRSLADEKR